MFLKLKLWEKEVNDKFVKINKADRSLEHEGAQIFSARKAKIILSIGGALNFFLFVGWVATGKSVRQFAVSKTVAWGGYLFLIVYRHEIRHTKIMNIIEGQIIFS